MRSAVRFAFALALLPVLLLLAPATRAQDVTGETYSNLKSETKLAPPDGATNAKAKGTAKTFYVDNGQKIVQKLQVSAQKLTRGTQYRLVVDGVDFGVYSPRGGSGTLALRFRDPAKGNLIAFPAGVTVDVRAFSVIQLLDDTTGEVVLQGTFAA